MMDWQQVIDLERDCRELANHDFLAEESEADARERMSEEELAADDDYLALRQRRQQPLRALGGKGQWGTWRKRKAGGKGRAGG